MHVELSVKVVSHTWDVRRYPGNGVWLACCDVAPVWGALVRHRDHLPIIGVTPVSLGFNIHD